MRIPGDEDTLDLCCGRKRCPVFKRKTGGFTVTDNGVTIELSDEQAAQAARWLLAKLASSQDSLAWSKDLHDDWSR